MKTMNNFAVQQLTKKQMNNVKGGGTYYCSISINGGPAMKGPALGSSLQAVEDQLVAIYSPFVEKEGDRLDVKCSTDEWAL